MTVTRIDPRERLLRKVYRAPSGCWEWLGSRWPNGYGGFYLDAEHRSRPAHRCAYLLLVGEIPEGFDVDHLCRNRACVNPLHLQAVPRRTNLLRGSTVIGIAARRSHCRRGHPLAYTRKGRPGQRRVRTCRECHRNRASARRAVAS